MSPRRTLSLFGLLLGVALAAPPVARASGDWTWPVRGPVVTPYRNGDDPYAAGQHRGIDIGAPVGTRVVAPTAGRVTFAGTAGSSGRAVTLRTADGRFDTTYLHLSSIVVRVGEQLGRGARLGAVGTTGRRSTARPHLHFGVREAGQRHAYRDPIDFLAPLGPASRGPRVPPHPVAAPPPLASRHAVHPLRATRPAPVHRHGLARAPLPARVPRSAAAKAAAPTTGSPAPRAAPGAHDPAASPAAVAPGAAPGRASLHPHYRQLPNRARSGAGFDIGAVVAVIGLLMAAALPSRGRDRGPAGERPRKVPSALRPLFGRS